MIFDILIYGDPILRRKSEPVTEFGEELRRFAIDMTETMRVKDGVGLAAPQVGRSIRLVVVDPTAGEREPMVLVNPEIVYSSEEREDYEEGCLSVPDIRLKVNRPSRVSVRALTIDGKEFTIENAGGLLARVAQHEIDHLDGILFVDRASPVQRQMVNGKLRSLAKSRKQKARSESDLAARPG